MRSLNEATKARPAASNAEHIRKLKAFLSPKQRAFVEDPHRFKTAVAGRRGGKTAADAVYLAIECLQKKTATLYLGLTLDSAKSAIWDTLITLLDSLKIPYEKSASPLRITFANGSFIRITGADMSNAAARLRGPKYSLIVIDECGFYSQVDQLVYTLLPTLADHAGTMALTSSPGILLSGLLYEAHEGDQKASWSQHHWSLLDNPHFMVPANDPTKYLTRGEEELDTICRLQFKGNRANPAFVREYMGKYVKDATSLVYALPPTAIVDGFYERKPQLGIAVSFGLGGEAAIVAMRYSEYSRKVYVESAEVGHWSPDVIADKLRAFKDPTYVAAYLGDFGAEVADEFRRRYEIPLRPTPMKSKAFFQDLLRADLIAGLVDVQRNCPILDEWSHIVRDEAGIEIEGQKSLMADAVLVLYGKLYNHHLKSWVPPRTDEEVMIGQLEEQGLAEKASEDELRQDWMDI